jgi:ribosomal protein S18 acetylase RimI-like enzyme
VHEADGYPMLWPADPARWLTPSRLLDAWVAERADAGGLAGHVALCSADGDAAAPVWSAATGLEPGRLGAVTRLFVSPEDRGSGVGRRLVDAACAGARLRALHPVLEVLDSGRAAMALYERLGWRRVASGEHTWSGATVLAHRYVAPGPAAPGAGA